MKIYNVMWLIIGLLFVSSFSSPSVGEISQDHVYVDNDVFTVIVIGNGNLPSYQFWTKSDPGSNYVLKLDGVFEAEDQPGGDPNTYDNEDKRVPGSNIAFPSLDWNFSSIIEDTDGSLHFNITSPGNLIQFNNHLHSGDIAWVTFNVVINDYEFQSNSSMLVMSYKFMNLDNPETTSRTNYTIYTGDSYLQVEDHVVTNMGTVPVGLSLQDDKNKVFISYSHFNSTLFHDPKIGIVTNQPISPTNSNQDQIRSDSQAEFTSPLNHPSKLPPTYIFGNNQLSDTTVIMITLFSSFFAVMIPVSIYFWKIGVDKR